MQQGPFAPRALPRFLATSGPSDTLSPSAASRSSRSHGLPLSAAFPAGRGGLHQLTPHALVTVLPLRPRRRAPPKPEEDGPAAFVHSSWTRPPVACSSRGYFRVHSRCGPVTRSPPKRWLRRRASAHSVSLLAAVQATGLLALTPVGLLPTERASLPWSYKLSEPEYLVGSGAIRRGIIESGFAAYAQCSADSAKCGGLSCGSVRSVTQK